MTTSVEAYEEYSSAQEEELILQQMPQVRYIARRIQEKLPRHVAMDDLVNAGVMGLIDALRKFDRSKHVKFGSYAKFRIKGAILDSLRELDWGPRDLRRKARLLEEVAGTLRASLGRQASEQEIAQHLGWELQELQELLTQLHGLEIGSFHIISPGDGKEEDLCEFIPNPPGRSPFHLCLRSEMKSLLAQEIASLSEKERQVLALYYFEELTMKETGTVMGIGESRVSQIHSLAIVRLRARLRELLGEGADGYVAFSPESD